MEPPLSAPRKNGGYNRVATSKPLVLCVISDWLEENLHRKLNDAIAGHGAAQGIDLADAVAQNRITAERAATHVIDVRCRGRLGPQILAEAVPNYIALHIAELRVIEDVEHLKPQLEAASVVAAEREVLEQRKVGHVDAGPTQVIARIRSLCGQRLSYGRQLGSFKIEVFVADRIQAGLLYRPGATPSAARNLI